MKKSIGMEVFDKVITAEERSKTIQVLERKLDPRLIKQRDAGRGMKLDYIGGHTVIRLLNEAFGYQWSFEIVEDEIVPSQPRINKYKNNEPEPQPPVVKVKGRLTVPGFGVKEQYGSKVIVGGASEQEASFKAASTDALKKCATMFGIGLELYGDDDLVEYDTGSGVSSNGPVVANTPNAAPKPPAKSASNNKPSTPPQTQQSSVPTKYDPADVAKIKELKAILGVTHNSELDPYAREFFDDKDATYLSVTPANIKAFCVFLSKKAQNA